MGRGVCSRGSEHPGGKEREITQHCGQSLNRRGASQTAENAANPSIPVVAPFLPAFLETINIILGGSRWDIKFREFTVGSGSASPAY